jgi:hypothetical protein
MSQVCGEIGASFIMLRHDNTFIVLRHDNTYLLRIVKKTTGILSVHLLALRVNNSR